MRSVVLLMPPTVLSDRKNGHRHNPLDTDPLEKVRLARVQALAGAPYQAVTVAQVEDFELSLLLKAWGSAQPPPPQLWRALARAARRGNCGDRRGRTGGGEGERDDRPA